MQDIHWGDYIKLSDQMRRDFLERCGNHKGAKMGTLEQKETQYFILKKMF